MLNYDEPLSDFAFKFNLRRYSALKKLQHRLGLQHASPRTPKWLSNSRRFRSPMSLPALVCGSAASAAGASTRPLLSST